MKTNQPCIAIDVSKGKSHVCGFTQSKESLGTVFEISHDKKGFHALESLKDKITQQTHSEPVFIYESTGIYHRPMKRYFDQFNHKYIEVNPLLAAKHRKNSAIRSVKTDARDTYALARLFYDVELPLNQRTDEVYYELKQLHRHYRSLTVHFIKCKVHFNETLDVLFPSFRSDVDDKVYNSYYLELLKQYPHPELLGNKRVDHIENILYLNGMSRLRTRRKAEEIKRYAQNCYPGSSVESVDTTILVSIINQIQSYHTQREEVIEKMTQLGNELPLYNQLQTIPGIASRSAVCLIAELGDLSRFRNSKQLIAYAGLDPVIYQSGQNDGKGLSVSKKGNKHLRTLLFSAVQRNVYSRYDHCIKRFFQKKKQNLTTKSAYIACCDKLLKVIFGMFKSGEDYIF